MARCRSKRLGGNQDTEADSLMAWPEGAVTIAYLQATLAAVATL